MNSRTVRIANLFTKIVKKATAAEILHGVEVGVWEGEMSSQLLKVCPNMQLTMVDSYVPYDDPKLGIRPLDNMHDALRAAAEATAFAADRRTMLICTSARASLMVPDGSQDYVYLDACHKYEFVKQDLQFWYPKVRSGGVFGGHDYDGRGDRRGWFGVKKAVDEWCKETDHTVTKASGNVWWVVKK